MFRQASKVSHSKSKVRLDRNFIPVNLRPSYGDGDGNGGGGGSANVTYALLDSITIISLLCNIFQMNDPLITALGCND